MTPTDEVGEQIVKRWNWSKLMVEQKPTQTTGGSKKQITNKTQIIPVDKQIGRAENYNGVSLMTLCVSHISRNTILSLSNPSSAINISMSKAVLDWWLGCLGGSPLGGAVEPRRSLIDPRAQEYNEAPTDPHQGRPSVLSVTQAAPKNPTAKNRDRTLPKAPNSQIRHKCISPTKLYRPIYPPIGELELSF